MQRSEADGVVICCDFCGTDWDQVKPMIEGHHGSVICLECLKDALKAMKPAGEAFRCTLCLGEGISATVERYVNPSHPEAAACADCIRQAARAFDRDPDVDWKWQR